MSRSNGLIIYSGPSQFDNSQIVVIATGFSRSSDNSKTGRTIQTFIIRADQNPIDALENGDDESMCGSCKMRNFRSCYVNVAQAPYQIYKAYKRGKYPTATKEDLSKFLGKIVRFGSYGDPVACPIAVWDSVSGAAKATLGYTHAWRQPQFQEYKKHCMASCDTAEEVERAKELGWRIFYARQANDPIPEGFFTCPASKEENHRLTCSTCLACSGRKIGDSNTKGNVSLIVHGPSWKMKFFSIGIKAFKHKKAYVNIVKPAYV